MSLLAGSKLGPYEILAPLGSGGMGEVYRARDTRLDRVVAVKILPPALSADADRLRRFEQEARSASALNHPNIVTIYERGQDGTTYYIAMELVEGKTLRELIASGLPMERAIELAAQIADGLAKAHEAGIAHRDLKPENIMVSHDGFAKILDFGLAKFSGPVSRAPDMQTMTGFQTRPGQVLGTVRYMSPEQASGSVADFRSDQFSFGLVLYELVAGRSAFHRNTAAETMVAIMREPAEPIGTMKPDAPAPLCWAIERCLAKDPEKRYVATRDLARELSAIRDHLRDRQVEKPARAQEGQPTNLPAQRTGFVGREKEIAAAKELLLREGVRLVTITGPGGIGKTRFALEVAGSLATEFSAGTQFVALSSLTEPMLVPSAIVQALGIREAGGQSPLEMLKEHLQSARGPMLLLLDNFEHLVGAAPMVASLLAMNTGLKVIVTSRAALRVSAEHEFPIPPLGMPEVTATAPIEVLSRFPAVALFVQRALAVKPDFELNKENAAAVVEICTRLDGLPLAIELAAARVKVLSPSSMRTRLRSRLQLLTGGARDMPERQQTLRAAIDWSYDLLTPAEQKVFRRLSVFVGGCTLEAAEAVCDAKGDLDLDLLDGMTSMVDKSLVQQIEPGHGESRFVMLETIREYAIEKLAASDEETLTRRAHAAFCVVLAEEATEHEDAKEREQRFAQEQDNFRAALEYLTETGDAVWGLRLGAALFNFWQAREQHAEARVRLDKLLKLPASAERNKLRERALFAAGVLANEQGDFGPSDEFLRESLAIAREIGDTQGAAVSLNALAVGARGQGDVSSARALLEESLALWRELGDQMAVARALSNLASIVKLEGDLVRARALYAECLGIFDALGDRSCVAWSFNYQGDCASDQGDATAARALYENALAIFRELNDGWGIAGTLADLGNLARDHGDHSAARAFYRASLRQFHALGHKRGIARLLECFACSAALEKLAEVALRFAGAAAALRQSLGAPLSPAEQGKLEVCLNSARQTLTDRAGTTVWLEGWALTIEQAVEELLAADIAAVKAPLT
jgi:predicted ATPase